MNESNKTPKPQSRAIAYTVVAVCAVFVLLAVFLWKPAPANTQSQAQASAGANSSTADQRLDPFEITSSLNSDIAQFTYGRVEGQDYQVEKADNQTNKYIMASSIGYLGIADEQDHINLYTDSATNAINKVEYQATVPQTEKSAFLGSFASKMTDLQSIFGNTYETLYYKDAKMQNADASYTYQKIQDALSAGQAGIYVINWSQNGLLISLKVDSVTDPKNYTFAVSFWVYANATGSAAPGASESPAASATANPAASAAASPAASAAASLAASPAASVKP